MAKGGHRRPTKRRQSTRRDYTNNNESKDLQRAKSRKRQASKNKTLLRQMRGMKWDEEEYSDEIAELDDME